MTSPARSRPEPKGFTPTASQPAQVAPAPAPEPPRLSPVEEALRRDQRDLERQVVLWQRWVRYAVVGALAAVALAFGPRVELAFMPLAVTTLAYLFFVGASAWYVNRYAGAFGGWLPTALVTADVATFSTLFYLGSTPALLSRILLLGLLWVQLSVFYFGRRLGTWAALLVVTSYATLSLAPPMLAGETALPRTVAFNAALFVLVAAVLVATFGHFRSRLNELRLFCSLVDDGENVGALRFTEGRLPDDLTLLARSFETMRSRMAEQIGTDALTGCLNRRALEARVRSEWRLAKRRGSNIAILALDLDNFKPINDSRGHPTGDIVLQQLAGIMKATARDTDAVARLGGDEFVIVLPDTNWQGAITFAERLRRRVDDFAFGTRPDTFPITISVGVALARGTDEISAELLLKEADRSLYKAKEGGRNRVYG